MSRRTIIQLRSVNIHYSLGAADGFLRSPQPPWWNHLSEQRCPGRGNLNSCSTFTQWWLSVFFFFFSSPFFPFLSNLLAGLACLRCGCRDEGLCTLHAQRQVEHMGSLEVDIISQWMSVDCRQSEAGTRDGHRECHLLIQGVCWLSVDLNPWYCTLNLYKYNI